MWLTMNYFEYYKISTLYNKYLSKDYKICSSLIFKLHSFYSEFDVSLSSSSLISSPSSSFN